MDGLWENCGWIMGELWVDYGRIKDIFLENCGRIMEGKLSAKCPAAIHIPVIMFIRVRQSSFSTLPETSFYLRCSRTTKIISRSAKRFHALSIYVRGKFDIKSIDGSCKCS